MLIYVAFLNCVLLKKMVFVVFFLFFFFFETMAIFLLLFKCRAPLVCHYRSPRHFFVQIHLPLLSSYTLIGIHQSRQSAGNVKSNVNNINVDNDIISQTFRTSVRFLKRNNDDNKTVNGTYSRLYSSKLFMSQFKY